MIVVIGFLEVFEMWSGYGLFVFLVMCIECVDENLDFVVDCMGGFFLVSVGVFGEML